MKRGPEENARCPQSTATLSMNTGLTLLELLIALAIGSVVISAVYAVYISQLHSVNTQDKIVAMRQNWRAGHYVLGRELMKAGYCSNIVSEFQPGFTRATKSALTFTYVEEGTDNLIPVAFDLVADDGVKRIVRTVSGVAAPIADDIETLQFIYVLKSGSTTWAPEAKHLNDIRSIRVTIVARTESSVADYPTPTAFALPFPDDHTENTLNFSSDGVYRQMVTGVFNCRNM